MFNLDPAKLLVIGIVAIILLGPDKLPNVAKQAGAAWRSFNEFRHRMESEVRNTVPDLPPTSEIARLARSPSALLHHLSTLSSDEGADQAPDGSYQPPDGAVDATDVPGAAGAAAPAGAADAARAAGAAGAADGEEATGAAADGAGSPASDAAQNGGPTSPPPGSVALPTPAPINSVTPSPSPEVIAPGDPTLN